MFDEQPVVSIISRSDLIAGIVFRKITGVDLIGGVVVIVRILRRAGSPICNGLIKNFVVVDGFERVVLLIAPLFDEEVPRTREDAVWNSSIVTNETSASDNEDKDK